MSSFPLAIIGAGNMAEAIVRGILSGGTMAPDQIIAADISSDRRNFFQQNLGITAIADAAAAVKSAEVVLLSVKPQQMAEALAGLRPALKADCLLISIAAGISTRFIESAFDSARRVVRCMPNTPMLVGCGMAVISPGRHATPADMVTARSLFESSAEVLELPEEKMDAVTALSGSGPAYFFYLAEQMIVAGEALGLTREQAHRLACRTAEGAGKMLAASPDAPAELRRKVTSPKGTTEAAITSMEGAGMGRIIQDAVKAAARRSAELGK